MDERCVNCGEDVENTDDRVGLIHLTGKYACYGPNANGKIVRLETVAEVSEVVTV